tara:strand:- start:2027 stop:3157 length:1131 start_codon:yes stop_codon:yes gene_type:complete
MSTKIPTFKKLTKETNGKIYEWQVKINKINEEHYEIITLNGYSDGKKAEHIVNIKKGKAGRTVLEQAILETQSKFNKKEKEYSTVIFKPMLADKVKVDLYTGKSKSRAFRIEFPAYVQPKLDGLRGITYLKNNEICIQSRAGNIFENFNVLKNQLKNIFTILGENVYLDGELFTDEFSFQELSGLVRITEEKVTEKELNKIDKIRYHVFDIYFVNTPDMPFKERFEKLQQLMKIKNINLIHLVETTLVKDFNKADEMHDNYVSKGGEGLMIRDINSIYEPNKRSKYLQKYKKFDEDEYKIVGFKDSEREKGLVIWVCEINSGIQFDVVPNGTKDERKDLYKIADKFIGKLLTVQYLGLTDDGIPKIAKGKDIREGY